MSQPTPDSPRKSLKDEVVEIDREILHLLMRRYNLLEKMRSKGRLNPAEEKFLREAWQGEVAKISRDAELSSRFFSRMQELTFLPRPKAGETGEKPVGALRREAFTLLPPPMPVTYDLPAPLDSRETRVWLYLAACAGQALLIGPSLQNDPIIDCVKALDQMGAAITRVDDNLQARVFAPLGAPDKVIHVGDSAFNFYLFLAHYIGRHSRCKFSGDSSLKLADFSVLRHFLPELGARMTHVVPGSNGLPLRVECSGILPAGVQYPAQAPAEFAGALLLAAPFYESPFALDLRDHPQKDLVLTRALPILDACGAVYSLDGDVVSLENSSLAIPHKPAIGMDVQLASFLLAFVNVLGGKGRLGGLWPNLPASDQIWLLAEGLGLGWRKEAEAVAVKASQGLQKLDFARLAPGQLEAASEWTPLLCALLACSAEKSGQLDAPQVLLEQEHVSDFLRACGITLEEGGKLGAIEPAPWNAPDPAWALALALAACARPKRKTGFLLGNPGIMTELWPFFWAFYNSLPNPKPRREPEAAQGKERRRIRTSVISTPPELKEEDLY